MGGGTDSYNRYLDDQAARDREAQARKINEARVSETAEDRRSRQQEVYWRPLAEDSLPPANSVVLVRYKGGRIETLFKGVNRQGCTVDKHHVYPAIPIYVRAPFSKDGRVFRGFVVLRTQLSGAEDAVTYTDGDVVDAFDAWMPCPS